MGWDGGRDELSMEVVLEDVQPIAVGIDMCGVLGARECDLRDPSTLVRSLWYPLTMWEDLSLLKHRNGIE